MAKNKKQGSELIFYLLALAIAVSVAIVYFAFPDKFAPKEQGNMIVGTVQAVPINKNIVGGLGELKQCGDWPLIQVSPSSNRGNPFTQKPADQQVMVATSSVECLNATRNLSQ